MIIFLKLKIKDFIQNIISLFPVKKNIWVFGAWRGCLYSDNTKYLFEYISTNYKNIDSIWITKNKKLVNEIRNHGFKAYYFASFKGIYYTIHAEAAFETEGEQDLSPFMNKHTIIFLLWHGLGVKDLKWKDKHGNLPSEKDFLYYKNVIWFSTSEYFTEILSRQMFSPKSNFYITGFARNDSFILKPENMLVEGLLSKRCETKKIIYMPTHRNFGKDGNELINKTTLMELNDLLLENNWVMVFKPHIHELKNIIGFCESFSNIIFADDSIIWGDPYSYLHLFDALVTDYSSVASDFICSSKPVVLFPYDIEHYKREDGGLLPIFYDLPSGPSCYSWKDVIETLDGLFINDTWAERREKCRKFYHLFNDGNNCKRNYDMATLILNRKIGREQ